MPHHTTYVAGTKFRPKEAPRFASLKEGDGLVLEPDPANEYDPNAVRVLVDGVHVGFVPRDLAPEIKMLIEAGRVERVMKRAGNRIEIHYSEGDTE